MVGAAHVALAEARALHAPVLLNEVIATLSPARGGVFLDATFGEQVIDPALSGHMNFAMVAETVAELRAMGSVTDSSAILVSHISLAAVPPHDQIEADLNRRGITLAYDGMVWTSGR